MEFQVEGDDADGIMHEQGLQPDICGQMPRSGNCLANNDDDDGQNETNGNSVADDDIDNGDTDYDVNEDDESEEDDDDLCEDDPQMNALINDLEVKFQQLVSTKIWEAEQFFDDANFLQRQVFLSTVTVIEAESNQVGGNFCPVENNNSGSHCRNSYVGGIAADANMSETLAAGGGGLKEASSPPKFKSCEVGTQTDDDTCSVVKSSGTLVSTENICNRDENLVPDQARAEIGQLRDVRDSLVTERQKWAAQLKQADEKTTEEELKKVECKIYEIEEAVEAIDTAIEFKNEIVIGQSPSKSSLAAEGNVNPGSSEAQLVTRLESLSTEELRRLLCVYFAKVVELRSSSRRLEKNLDHTENEIEQLKRRSVSDRKYFQTQHEEDVNRIRLFISSGQSRNHPDNENVFRDMHDKLMTTRKKKHDLEISLTELLIRHGYLVNGADYDVKQVVRMLGIDRSQVGGGETSTRTTTARKITSAPPAGVSSSYLTSAHHTSVDSQKTGRTHCHHHNNLGSRRNAQILDGREFSRIHRADPTGMTDMEREYRQTQVSAAGAASEVRREGGRIIIQPPASSSNYSSAHAGPNNHKSRHHNHHFSSSRHGYK